MAEWKPLPDTLEPDARALVEQLRRLKDRSGLSLAALAERTLHSKSSWERYLNGKSAPPRQAVDALGRLVGADPARLAAQWELAARAWSRQDSPGTGTGTGTGTGPMRGEDTAPVAPPGSAGSRKPWTGRPTRRWLVLAAALVLVVGGAAIALWTTHRTNASAVSERPAATGGSGTKPLHVSCFEQSCTGMDPKAQGCGDPWTSALTRIDGVYVELRYSDSCKAAWARISWSGVGDIARVVGASGTTEQDRVHYDTDVYSPMVGADTPSDARACTVLTSGAHGCTKPGGTIRLTPPPDPPVSVSPSSPGG
ncbi:helix-turn-helix domain-containing protein [Streptomyces sp. NPDC002514]|uniref:helix-turn-helix domain-containing protein n=1 Tax=Streptomyces sp. NPDC001270 TaxID=3364554 RepID=UPI003686FE76